jgi:hypothetical protein
MVSGHTRLMADIKQRFPAVPDRVFSWSNGVFFAFIASRTLDRGQGLQALKFFVTAIWNDPSVILRFFEVIVRRILARLARRSPGRIGWPSDRTALAEPPVSEARGLNATSQPLGVFAKRRLAWIAKVTPLSRQTT